MSVSIDEIKSFLDVNVLPELDKGRPNWDKFHTIGVVHHVEKIVKHSGKIVVDPYVLLITAYVHDWGYVDLFENGAVLTAQDVSNAKVEHMRIGAIKTEKLLKNSFFKFLTDEQKKEIVHIVQIHDSIDSIKSNNERIFLEADTLGGLDTNFCKPAFDEESNNKYMLKIRNKNLPLFLTKYGKDKFEELFELRTNYYDYKKDQKLKNVSVFKEVGEYKGRKYKLELFFGNPGVLPKIDQAQAVAFCKEKQKLNIVFFKHKDGHYGIPGGGVEKGEVFVDTIKRESMEEINSKVIDFGYIGYEIMDYPETGERKYFGRYWTMVEKLHGIVNDPCGKALERVIVPYENAVDFLGWGEKGRLLIEEAFRQFTN